MYGKVLRCMTIQGKYGNKTISLRVGGQVGLIYSYALSYYFLCVNVNKLTLKALMKFAADTILELILLFFRENKAWHFMWFVSSADDSHEM